MLFNERKFFITSLVLILVLLGQALGVTPVQAGMPGSTHTDKNTSLFPENTTNGVGRESVSVGVPQNQIIFPTVVTTSPQHGDVLLNNPSTISVQFSANMLANGTAFAVNKPANYLLVEDGADGKFQTTSCMSGLAGDDTLVPINKVTYNATNFTSTLTVSISDWPVLNQASYQLIVCASTRITDLAGNRLNDGTDSVIRFVVLKELYLYPYTNYGGGAGKAVGIGDFNHDGLTDVVMTTASQVLVYLKDSNGNLNAPVAYAAGLYSRSLAVGDLNNDGWDDVVTANSEPTTSTISVFLQQSDGTFAPRITYSLPYLSPTVVAVGDVTGDGLLDVVVSESGSLYMSSISVFAQDINGSLDSAVYYNEYFEGGEGLAIGDVNNDGRNDVVKMNTIGSNPDLSVYLQNASGTLSDPVPYFLDCDCRGSGIEIGDVTGDGLSDVVISYGGNRPNSKIAVFAQGQDSSLQPSVSYDAYDTPEPVELADINQDGTQDILVLHGGWRSLGVFLQKKGVIQPSSLYTFPSASTFQPQSLAVGDINQDGAVDIAIADSTYGLTTFYYHEKPAPHVIMGGNANPVDGEELGAGTNQLTVQFDRQMRNDGDPSSVNNPSNYLFVDDGADDNFQTSSCAVGLAGDDALISVDSATYDSSKYVSTLSVNGGVLLGAGSYRLLVCSTTSIEDAAGVPLNGGLSDTTITFTVWPTPYNISGNVGTAGAILSYTDNVPRTVIADGVGDYSFKVSENWSGTVTPTKLACVFSPANKIYTNVTSSIVGENYTAAPATYTISGNVGLSNVFVKYFNSSGQSDFAWSDIKGDYSITVPYGWSGSVSLYEKDHTFSPASRNYVNVVTDITNENYTPIPNPYTISGNTGVGGVSIEYTLNDSFEIATSDENGNYSLTVPLGWTGTVYPSRVGYRFSPESRSYNDLQSSQANQDFVPERIYTISGNAGVSGVTLSYVDGTPKTVTSYSGGNYSFQVPEHWSGTITPARLGYRFAPPDRTYSDVVQDQLSQNYIFTRVVVNSNDSGPGSLRQAIADATGGAKIYFDPALAGQTIVLSSEIAINKSLTIDGRALDPHVSISGNHAVRIFNAGSNVSLTLHSLILKDGMMGGTSYTKYGGAIYTNLYSTVMVTDVDFVGNTAYRAGAIYVSSLASATILESRFSANTAQISGGAIYAGNNLIVRNSVFINNEASAVVLQGPGTYVLEHNTFVGNHALSGGAIAFQQSNNFFVTIRNNLFSNNIADSAGGAIRIVYSGPQQIMIENNTFYANQSKSVGGAIATEGNVQLRNNTFSENRADRAGGNAGGSIYISSAGVFTELFNNIFANNAGGGECYEYGVNSWIRGNNNLIEDGSGACATLPGTIISDPLLGPLTDHGGPTQTMALLPGSPAIDAGDNTHCPETDQRGMARSLDGNNDGSVICDIGAYEFGYFTISGNAGVAGATLSYFDGVARTVTADNHGDYSFGVLVGWSGLVTPYKPGYIFSPASKTYSNITADQSTEDYTATVTDITFTISGNAGVAGATLSYEDETLKTIVADENGEYSFTVPYSWIGTVTPTKADYRFVPGNIDYFGVQADQPAQDYAAIALMTISGNAGISGTTLNYVDEIARAVTADGNGNYAIQVPIHWSGTVTPLKAGYRFSPIDRTYTDTTTNQINQDYIATQITYSISGNAGAGNVTLSVRDSSVIPPVTTTVLTDDEGNYIINVPYRWSGEITPSKTCCTFSPVKRQYFSVQADQEDQNFQAFVSISGNAGVAGATLNYSDGTAKSVTADGSGNYALTVSYNWSGTITPSKPGYLFAPFSRGYTNVVDRLTAQDYLFTTGYIITGNAGVAGATMNYLDGTAKSITAGSNGVYTITVPEDWSGTVTPSKPSVTFDPAHRAYDLVNGNQTAQDYTATITVTTNADNGTGSLRQAVIEATSGATIRFAPALSGQTILLASEIAIDKSLTIDGSGLNPRVEVSGGDAVKIFVIGEGYGIHDLNVVLRSLILKNAKGIGTSYYNTGAAILMASSNALTVEDLTFMANSAVGEGAAINSGGTVTVLNSEFISNSSQNSGGAISISATGRLTIKNSSFRNNSARYSGGAVAVHANWLLAVENATFDSNTAMSGGAIVVTNPSITGIAVDVDIRNSLFARNTASSSSGSSVGGAIDFITGTEDAPAMVLENNTFFANHSTGMGGAIYTEASIILRNNTFSENAADSMGNPGASLYLRPPFVDASIDNNIFANNTRGGECGKFSALNLFITGNGNLVEDGSPACVPTVIADPKLELLADNGGPTQTLAVLPGSPAIDAGDDTSCPKTDQRGVARPQGSHCDIGAYESTLGAFNKSTPGNGATDQSTSLDLNWGASSGATSYEYCYDTTNDNMCSPWRDNGTDTGIHLVGLNNNTTYYWHVRAVNTVDVTYSNGSSVDFWSFTTIPLAAPHITIPSQE
ncbi:MAG TPA: choice-of-anchor Q domain-containing protein [Anaerolineales bacterium]|nr:choice-of-anchor Q domain-containing protein [Anaerolineales bacterium]